MGKEKALHDPEALLRFQLQEERQHFTRGILWGAVALLIAGLAFGAFLLAEHQVTLRIGEPSEAEGWVVRAWLVIGIGILGAGGCGLGFLVEWTRWLVAMMRRRANSSK